MAKAWGDRLNEAIGTSRLLLGDEAGDFIERTMEEAQPEYRETISKQLSLGWTTKKKGTTQYAERKTRRAVVLLEAVAQLIPSMPLAAIKPLLVLASSAAKAVNGAELTRLLNQKWEACQAAQAVLDRWDAEAKATMRRQAAERRAQMRRDVADHERAFLDNPRAFMCAQSVVPSPSIPGSMDFTVLDVADRDRVKSMEFAKSQTKRGAIDLVYPPADQAGPIDVYFLPWSSRHITRLAIPAYQRGTPDVFFTSALSGCSVYVTGTAQAPVVWHAGVDGTVGVDPRPAGRLGDHWTKYNAVGFWQRNLVSIMNGERPDGTPKIRLQEVLATLAEVNKTHYVDDVSVPGAEPSEDQRGTTTHSRAFRELHPGGRGQVEIDTISCWGCVFGVRAPDTRDWSFYLQENVCVSYREGGSDDPALHARSLPLAVRKFFPLNPAGHTFPHQAWNVPIDARTAFA